VYDIADPTLCREIPAHTRWEDLLVPVLRAGREVGPQPSLAEARERARTQLAALSPRTTRLLNPQPYPVGLERRLHELKWSLVSRARGQS
jgi:nicotinate phosphoribosyltransferase